MSDCLTTKRTELIDALRDYHQADEEGIMVLVSRQACDEGANTIEASVGREQQLRRNLEAHIVHHVGSGFWHCGFCRAMRQSPIAFEHTPDCMLAPTAGEPNAEDVARDAVEIMRLRCAEAARIACLTLPEADYHAQQRARLHVTAAIEKLRFEASP